MSGVKLSTVWLNNAAAPADFVAIPYVTQINPTPITPGEVRQYGGGRFRAVLTGASQKSRALAAQACDPTVVKWLTDHDGTDIWYRDDSSEKFHGIYFAPAITRHQYNADSDVSFTVLQTSGTEAV